MPPGCNTNSQEKSYGAGNSYISLRADVGAGSYIEDSYLHHGTVVGERCVISGVTLDGQKRSGGYGTAGA